MYDLGNEVALHEELAVLNGDGSLGGEGLQDLHVLVGEDSLHLVDRFDYPQHLIFRSKWNPQDALGLKLSQRIQLSIEPRIVNHVLGDNRLSMSEYPTRDAVVGWNGPLPDAAYERTRSCFEIE